MVSIYPIGYLILIVHQLYNILYGKLDIVVVFRIVQRIYNIQEINILHILLFVQRPNHIDLRLYISSYHLENHVRSDLILFRNILYLLHDNFII